MSKTRKSLKAEKAGIMEKLLQTEQENLLIPKKGEAIKGLIVDIGSNAIYIDLGQFGVGVVRGEELQTGISSVKDFKIGDTITAVVEELDNEQGMVELSFRQASMEKVWSDIKEKMAGKEVINVKILQANKGGLMIELHGIPGFLPVSQLSPEHYPRVEDNDRGKILSKLRDFVGKNLPVRIIDADLEAKKLIVSEKAIQDERRKKDLGMFAIGDVIEGYVSGVVDFGAFVKFAPRGENMEEISEDKKLEGLVHISELAWQLIDDPRDVIKSGEKVRAKIISIENDGRISLSIKGLSKDPWSQAEEKYKVGDKAKGNVAKVNHFGAFVYLDKDIHGLVHISELSKYKGDNKLEVGKEYDFEILSIEPKDHKMGLKLFIENDKDSEKKENKKPKKTEKTEKAGKAGKAGKDCDIEQENTEEAKENK